jgi:hypothetical protein
MKQIPGYEGIYACDIYGNIYALARTIMKTNGWSDRRYEWNLPLKKLSPALRRDGYLHVNLRKNGKGLMQLSHRLIAKTFLGCTKEEINHIDGNKTNNNLDNLELSTRSDNVKHAFKIGLRSNKGKNHPGYFIDEDLQKKVVNLLREGLFQSDIAKLLNIGLSSISEINMKYKVRHKRKLLL